MDIFTEERLETPKEFASSRGLSEGQVRRLIQRRQLEHVRIGSRILVPTSAWPRFLASNTVKPCQDETKDHDFAILKSAKPITSPGPRTVAAASAQLARQTASKLKSHSQNGYNSEGGEMAQVIHLQSS